MRPRQRRMNGLSPRTNAAGVRQVKSGDTAAIFFTRLWQKLHFVEGQAPLGVYTGGRYQKVLCAEITGYIPFVFYYGLLDV